PQTGILGVGRIVQKAVVRGGQVAVRDVMGLSLTFDHRVMDGAPAGEFLTTLVRMLEEPTLLLF
ncbi:MAG: 2-oxo acid dehydrogenase subunit E2, partial [Desulfovibrio sp.]|nr:2-oxo acid dehydrogenase subunit E2 [Desulfovibrio sp.]